MSLTDPPPDYPNYTLDQLYDVLEHIDRDKYPDRVQVVQREIQARIAEVRTRPPDSFEDEKIEPQYRTFVRRFYAAWLDGFVLFPLTLAGSFLVRSSLPAPLFITFLFILNAGPYVYRILLHGLYGQTIGKMLTGVIVVDVSAKPLSMKQSVFRDVIPLGLSLLGFILFYPVVTGGLTDLTIAQMGLLSILALLQFVWEALEIGSMLTNRKRRAIHDFIAGSVVVRQSWLEEHDVQVK